MASFLKSLTSLFSGSGGGSPAAAPAPTKGEDYKGFTIRATPFKESGQYQTCGTVEKEIGGEMKSHRFIRADRFASEKEAADFSLTKARQLVDEQGERLFS